jgi:hypothetical protein
VKKPSVQKRRLRVGDQIRIVRMPAAFALPGYHVPPETRWVFRKLIERKRPLRVYQIDVRGFAWVHCRFRRPNGTLRYDSLAVDPDAWEKVKKRRG